MFSVIIPYYKKRHYIERCLDSVLNQTYQEFEIILVDDGSQDDIKDLVKEKYDGRIKVIVQENQGVSAARNTGIRDATYEWVALLDADDMWHPNFLSSIAEVIANEKNAEVIGTAFTNSENKLATGEFVLRYKEVTRKQYLYKAPYTAVFNSSSICFRKTLVESSGYFDVTLRRGEDLDMWLRLVMVSKRTVKIQNVLSFYDLETEQQATRRKTEFKKSYISKLKEVSEKDQLHYDFARRFVTRRLLSIKENYPDAYPDLLSFFNIKEPIIIRFSKLFTKSPIILRLINYHLIFCTKYKCL